VNQKLVKITNNGTISIPKSIRKKFEHLYGNLAMISEEADGTLKIRPLESIELVRERSITVAEYRALHDQIEEEASEQQKDLGIQQLTTSQPKGKIGSFTLFIIP